MVLGNLKIGMKNAIQKKIEEKDTAIDFGFGATKVLLSTPALVLLMIEAAVKLVDPLLPEGYITIGKVLNIDHLQPTTKDMLVTVNASISEIERHKIVFTITAYDELGEIGRGYHERYVVNNELLEVNVKKRVEPLKTHP